MQMCPQLYAGVMCKTDSVHFHFICHLNEFFITTLTTYNSNHLALDYGMPKQKIYGRSLLYMGVIKLLCLHF